VTAASDRTLTDDGVTTATARALRTAMHRLLTRAARCTDGQLTKQNLWKEAGVSRATMNRAHTILAEWDDQVAQRSTVDPKAARRDEEIHELRLKLAAKKRECTDLHRRLDAATTAIAALHHDNTLLRQELAYHRADVIPIRPAT
jgi:predicted RNase H-like nuclease (RuvC/YqgF family)